MKFLFTKILFFGLAYILLSFATVFAQEMLEIQVTGADAFLAIGTDAPLPDALDSSDAPFTIPKEAQVSHADGVVVLGLDQAPVDALDSADALFKITAETQVCHADGVWNNGLNGVEINNGSVIQQEIITGEQEWAQNRSIDRQVIISSGAQLTIKKGVRINFQSNGSILVNGSLLAKGTVKNPIVFSGMNGYAGKIVTVGELGKADFRNTEISTSAIDGGLSPRQTAILVIGAGILEMQACNINGNATGIELNHATGGNIKINRSKFSSNIIDAASNNPANATPPDFKYNWWGSADGPNQSRIIGNIDSLNWISKENFHDPVILVPGILGSWPENGELKIDPLLHTFDGLIAQLEAAGYTKGIDLFEFPYEWRNSNSTSALYLAGLIDTVKKETKMSKVDIVSHSMGGLVSREYIESDYYRDDIDQLITIATPNNGSPQSYLTWESGNVGPSVLDGLLKTVFVYEAKENRYPDVFSYVRAKFISVLQLLPIYSYLYEADTGSLRPYPSNYPSNYFLENLNLVENTKKIEKVEYDKIIADLNNNQGTITGFIVENASRLPQWEHGYPVNYDIVGGSRGMVKGSGDGTVPSESSQSANIPGDETLVIVSNHIGAISAGRQEVVELLAGYRPQAVGVNWQMPNLMLVQVFSPVDIQIVASNGQWAGKNISNLLEVDKIPGAYYTGFDTETEFIAIPNPDGDYKILTQGTGAGDYAVKTTLISQNSETGQAQETTATIQGTAILGKVDQASIDVSNGKVIVESDILAPVIKINSPENGKAYLNNQTLPINYQVSDNKTATDTIEVGIYLDDATTTGSIIDLAFQKTGNHMLKIKAKDEAGNATSTAITFKVSASIGSIIVNVSRCAAMGLISKTEKSILNVQLQLLKTQFSLLEQAKSNSRLSAKAKSLAIAILKSTINSQIDIIIKGIQKTSIKLIDTNIALLLIDSLRYIKIN